MKLTASVVRQFEEDQNNYGTKTALHNVLWLSASEQLKDLGITHIKTSDHKKDAARERVNLINRAYAKKGK